LKMIFRKKCTMLPHIRLFSSERFPGGNKFDKAFFEGISNVNLNLWSQSDTEMKAWREKSLASGLCRRRSKMNLFFRFFNWYALRLFNFSESEVLKGTKHAYSSFVDCLNDHNVDPVSLKVLCFPLLYLYLSAVINNFEDQQITWNIEVDEIISCKIKAHSILIRENPEAEQERDAKVRILSFPPQRDSNIFIATTKVSPDNLFSDIKETFNLLTDSVYELTIWVEIVAREEVVTLQNGKRIYVNPEETSLQERTHLLKLHTAVENPFQSEPSEPWKIVDIDNHVWYGLRANKNLDKIRSEIFRENAAAILLDNMWTYTM